MQVPHGHRAHARRGLLLLLEALQNVAKYARARHVVVQVEDVGDRVDVRRDRRRCGLRPGEVDRPVGLPSLADRCALLGGVFRMQSIPGGGTLIAGWVPTPAANGSMGNGWTEAAAAVAAVRPWRWGMNRRRTRWLFAARFAVAFVGFAIAGARVPVRAAAQRPAAVRAGAGGDRAGRRSAVARPRARSTASPTGVPSAPTPTATGRYQTCCRRCRPASRSTRWFRRWPGR